MNRGSMDEVLCNMRRRCTMELAGMLKEKGEGTMKELNVILARFCIQEGRTMKKTKEYLSGLQGAGLVEIKDGKKKWKYHPENEWDLFSINI